MLDLELSEEDKTKYEKSRIIGSRALQLSMGAPFLIDLDDEWLKEINYNPVQIAKREYEEGAIPMNVDREAMRNQ